VPEEPHSSYDVSTCFPQPVEVRWLGGLGRSDADVRGDVLQALMLDSLVPDTVDAKVTDGSSR
jgi:hypothetical protein